jgi:hypothetical protein
MEAGWRAVRGEIGLRISRCKASCGVARYRKCPPAVPQNLSKSHRSIFLQSAARSSVKSLVKEWLQLLITLARERKCTGFDGDLRMCCNFVREDWQKPVLLHHSAVEVQRQIVRHSMSLEILKVAQNSSKLAQETTSMHPDPKPKSFRPGKSKLLYFWGPSS